LSLIQLNRQLVMVVQSRSLMLCLKLELKKQDEPKDYLIIDQAILYSDESKGVDIAAFTA
jgi:hypothetical protein